MLMCCSGALQDLKDLDLRNNSISGMLRPSWAGLPSLRTLDLSYNALNGSVPASLFRAPALETALLFNNQLTGTLPAFQGQAHTYIGLHEPLHISARCNHAAHFWQCYSAPAHAHENNIVNCHRPVLGVSCCPAAGYQGNAVDQRPASSTF